MAETRHGLTGERLRVAMENCEVSALTHRPMDAPNEVLHAAYYPDGEAPFASYLDPDEAELMVAAVNALPELLSASERLHKIEEMRERVKDAKDWICSELCTSTYHGEACKLLDPLLAVLTPAPAEEQA